MLIPAGCNSGGGSKKEEPDKKSSEIHSGSEMTKAPVVSEPSSGLSVDSVQVLLKGKWLRMDGTYTIEIFSFSAGGKLDAGYFNPNPINVGQSRWLVNEGHILIEIVLRDVNYPGSKYDLVYDKKSDCLAGSYFQAVEGINYDVIFHRVR